METIDNKIKNNLPVMETISKTNKKGGRPTRFSKELMGLATTICEAGSSHKTIINCCYSQLGLRRIKSLLLLHPADYEYIYDDKKIIEGTMKFPFVIMTELGKLSSNSNITDEQFSQVVKHICEEKLTACYVKQYIKDIITQKKDLPADNLNNNTFRYTVLPNNKIKCEIWNGDHWQLEGKGIFSIKAFVGLQEYYSNRNKKDWQNRKFI